VEDKENLMDWLMTFAEKNGSPTLYGKTNNPVSRDEMLTAFEDISDGTTGMVLGVEDEVGVLESSHKGETFFTTLQYKDNQIFRRLFIGNLLLGDNSQTGTYAQSQTQLDFTTKVYDGILEEIANTIQEQVINPVVAFNFGANAQPPVISFDKFSSGDMQKLFNILTPLMQNGVVDSENTAVQESIGLLFKAEAGVEYTNEEVNMPLENFEYQEPVDGADLTDNILGDLDGI
jgi:phage gp29-like protein